MRGVVSVTVYGGAGEIGGNKILLEGEGKRIFLDFGMSFKKHGLYFSEFIKPRTNNGVRDYLALGLVPWLDGLYRNDFLKHDHLKTSGECAFDGVLLSHPHMDHMSYVFMLHEKMPIYCSSLAKDVCSTLGELGSGVQYDLVKTTKSFEWYANKSGGTSRVSHSKDPSKHSPRNYPLTAAKGGFDIGGIQAEMHPVDHSIVGAVGYAIHIEGKTVGYTGDIRFHGHRRKDSEEFVRRLAGENVDVLIMEGTNLSPNAKSDMTEAGVEKEISRLIATASGKSVFAAYPARDTDRLMSFYRAARASDRKLAISAKQAYLLDKLAANPAVSVGRDVVKSDDAGIAVYMKMKDYGLIGESGVDLNEKKRDYDAIEKEYVGLPNQVCWLDLKERPEEYVLCMDNYSIQELLNIAPGKGAIYIKSQCEPFDDEMEIDWARIENWLAKFGIRVERAHASGHMFAEEAKQLLEEIAPRKVVPVHTENPDVFKTLTGAEVIVPAEGQKIDFG